MIYDPMSRPLKVLVALSQLVNVALLPDHVATGPGETVSGRAHRNDWRVRHVINWLFFWQDDHCRIAYQYDLNRAKQHAEMG